MAVLDLAWYTRLVLSQITMDMIRFRFGPPLNRLPDIQHVRLSHRLCEWKSLITHSVIPTTPKDAIISDINMISARSHWSTTFFDVGSRINDECMNESKHKSWLFLISYVRLVRSMVTMSLYSMLLNRLSVASVCYSV